MSVVTAACTFHVKQYTVITTVNIVIIVSSGGGSGSGSSSSLF